MARILPDQFSQIFILPLKVIEISMIWNNQYLVAICVTNQIAYYRSVRYSESIFTNYLNQWTLCYPMPNKKEPQESITSFHCTRFWFFLMYSHRTKELMKNCWGFCLSEIAKSPLYLKRCHLTRFEKPKLIRQGYWFSQQWKKAVRAKGSKNRSVGIFRLPFHCI